MDESDSTGCDANGVDGDYGGFEFLMEAVIVYDTDTSVTDETLRFYSCSGSSWQITNKPLYTDRTLACSEAEAVAIAIEEEDLSQFAEYDDTTDWRFFVTSVDSAGVRTAPLDELGPMYFTQGSVDFGFEDCFAPTGTDADGDGIPVENDPDCEKFKKFGYVPEEDCFNGIDDNEDGLIDCLDPHCYFDPVCGLIDPDLKYDPSLDNTAPKLDWHKVEKFDIGAMVMFDTNKPSNGTLQFYGDDSECSTLNYTIYDMGTYDSLQGIESGIKEYKINHDAPIDNFEFNPQAIGYDLSLDTTYYYKLKICGLNHLCSTSKCLNFKTAKSKNFADCPKCNPIMQFGFNAPTGAGVNDPFGQMDFFIKGSNDGEFSQVPDYCGMQLDWSNLTNADWKLTNQNATKGWAITLENSSLAVLDDADKQINGSALILEEADNGADYVGMEGEQWENLEKANPEAVELEIPKSDYGCDELWKCDDDLDNCVQVDAEEGVVLKVDGDDSCVWGVPGDLGFSVYGPADAAPAASTSSSAASSSSGSSGGGLADPVNVTEKKTGDEVVGSDVSEGEGADKAKEGAEGPMVSAEEVKSFVLKNLYLIIAIAVLVIMGLLVYLHKEDYI